MAFLQDWLAKLNIPFAPIAVEGSTHLCVQFPQSSYSPLFKIKTVLAHYDRAEVQNSPGANDNSAAVYQVLMFAKRLLSGELSLAGNIHNMRIFFTDGEELGSGAKTQGAFGLASLFKKLGIQNDDVCVADGCGRGDVLVVSSAGKNSPGSVSFIKRFDALYERICNLAKEASAGKWVSIPVPYSDNAGFLAAGVPAVALTVLPSDEASVYMRQLQKDKDFAAALMTHGLAVHGAGFSSLSEPNAADAFAKLRKSGIDPAAALMLSEKLPRTWRMMHTEHDTEASLTPSAFILMERFFNMLASSRTMV